LSSIKIKIVTLNLLRDLSRWEQRRSLLVDGLTEVQADIIALQEVALPQDNAAWLAEQLNRRSSKDEPYVHYLCPKTGQRPKEGIAILTRLPVEIHTKLDLGSQNRVAQLIKVVTGEHNLILANLHLFWFPGKSRKRLLQVDRIFKWLDNFSQDASVVLCGDFNSPPESPTIQKVEQRFVSAYKVKHGKEPDFTVPTRLPVSKLFQTATLLRFILTQWKQIRNIDLAWHGTLDYIFVDHQAKVEECELILNHPAPGKPNLYPSDHFGLCANLKMSDSEESR
jgi:endonuclease/exonuclease/phosphatase family metal-dependent hydrolase